MDAERARLDRAAGGAVPGFWERWIWMNSWAAAARCAVDGRPLDWAWQVASGVRPLVPRALFQPGERAASVT